MTTGALDTNWLENAERGAPAWIARQGRGMLLRELAATEYFIRWCEGYLSIPCKESDGESVAGDLENARCWEEQLQAALGEEEAQWLATASDP